MRQNIYFSFYYIHLICLKWSKGKYLSRCFGAKKQRATRACKQHGGCSVINPNPAHQYSLEVD
jgi:hypothetical protein